MQLGQLDAERLARERIEMGERLVEQQHARFHRQRAGERQAPALGQLERGRPALGTIREPQAAEHERHAALDVDDAHPLLLEPEGHVLAHRHVPPQRALLEDIARRAPAGRQAGDVLPIDDDAAVAHRHEAGHGLQHVGLAGVRRPEEREELAVADVDRDVIEPRRRPPARAQRLQANVDQCPCAHGSCTWGAPRWPPTLWARRAARGMQAAPMRARAT